jgi:hypothetical protein
MWTELVARVGEEMNVSRILMGKTTGKGILLELKEIGLVNG